MTFIFENVMLDKQVGEVIFMKLHPPFTHIL